MSSKQLELAEQQILGFHSAKIGETWQNLIGGMNLTIEEYGKLEDDSMIDYLSEDEKSEIINACYKRY